MMGAVFEDERAPRGVRQGVRDGILASIEYDIELRGSRTAHRIVAAALLGVLGAVGATLLVSNHPFDHHPAWHVMTVSTIWAGLLFVSFALVFLRVRTPLLPLGRSASVGLMSLGLAGVCGAACPDPHFLHWWSATSIGEGLAHAEGLALSALCFGALTAAALSGISAFALLGVPRSRQIASVLAASFVVALQMPGLALQSVDTSWFVFLAWAGGTASGAYLGIVGGVGVRALVGLR